MTVVRAGVVPGRRVALYVAIGAAVGLLICAAVVAAFGLNRVVTGLALGGAVALGLLYALFTRDGIMLSEQEIVRRTPWTADSIAWNRVVAGRFALDDHARWALALDLNGSDEPHQELTLLSIPPVTRPVANAYDLRKREQVNEIRTMLRDKRIPVTVLPEIADALSHHWKIAPPTR